MQRACIPIALFLFNYLQPVSESTQFDKEKCIKPGLTYKIKDWWCKAHISSMLTFSDLQNGNTKRM